MENSRWCSANGKGVISQLARFIATPPSQTRSVSPVQSLGPQAAVPGASSAVAPEYDCLPLQCRGPNHATGDHRQDLCHDMKTASSANRIGRQSEKACGGAALSRGEKRPTNSSLSVVLRAHQSTNRAYTVLALTAPVSPSSVMKPKCMFGSSPRRFLFRVRRLANQ